MTRYTTSLLVILCLTSAGVAVADLPDWGVHPSDFELSATMTAILYRGDEVVAGEANRVGAFVGGDCRGVASPIYVEALDRWMIFLTLYSNANGETIQFKAYIAEGDMVLDIEETIVFQANRIYGDPLDPSELHTISSPEPPANRFPTLAPIGSQTIQEGSTLTITLVGSDPDNDALSYSLSGNPLGSSLSDNVFTWTPGYDQSGTYSITFSVSDGRGGSASDRVRITVKDTNRSPALSAIGNRTIREGSTWTISLSASDPDGDSITFSVFGNPPGSTLSGTTFTWSPTAAQTGSHTVTFTASDGRGGSDAESMTITVEATPALVGDFDDDGVVGLNDFLLFIRAFGSTEPDTPFDLDRNGNVGLDDFLIFVGSFGTKAGV